MRQHRLEGSVAIIGLGCVLPDSLGPDAFWQNGLRGHSALRPLGGPQWERCHDPDPLAPDRSHTLIGARVERYQFDWRRFRMPPAEVERINPMQLMILEAGAAALGEVRVLPRGTTGVILGATGLGWQRDSGLRIRLSELCEAAARSPRIRALPKARREAVFAAARSALEARLQPVSEDNVVNAAASVAAGRIAMHFDLRGLHYAVDAAFASSLAALDVGVRLLRDRTLDAVLIGGASELLTPLELVAFAKLGGLSRGRLAPFDAAADGTLLGEGAVLLALKRLPDALRDGEKIYAILRGVGASSDGRGRALCAPHWEGQALAMRRAFEDGGISAGSVGFVECHATGTQVGDVSELRALSSAFADAAPGVAIGSAKPLVGHLRAAAGAVGLLRAVLALHHRVIPAQLNYSTPNPALELDRSPFFIPVRPLPLLARGGAEVPRAAVSAFGFGGNNFHAVLEAYDPELTRRSIAMAAPTSIAGPIDDWPIDEPIAIIGMGGCFPGAPDVPSFWRLLCDGKDTTREVPPERWDIDRYYDADRDRPETCYTRLGCFLDQLPVIEERWRIPPSSAPTLDPGQLLMLKVAEEALRDAGFDARQAGAGPWDRDRIAVMLAFLPYQGKKFLADIRVNCGELLDALRLSLREAGLPTADAHAALREAEAEMKAALPAISEDTLVGYLGSLNAGRITNHFDFHGPHFVVDSACASTHAALHAAVQGLRQRTCDVAVSGGTWCDMMPEFFIAACRFQALSARGSTPFGAGADGFVPGEGAGAFVLRRLRDAERDGQRIHAVIRSVAGSSDGRGRSVLAPSPAGEALAMTRALAAADISPAQVDYVECHGTGTALGDSAEVEACTSAYGPDRDQPLLIGSVKSNIGHLNAAAGVPGLIKAVLAVREGFIPASLKAGTPNPKIDFASCPVRLVTANTPWRRTDGAPRRAGVSSFGVGGSNLHLLVEEYRPVPAVQLLRLADGHEDESFLPIAAVQGASPDACVGELRRLLGSVAGGDPPAWRTALASAQTSCSGTVPAHRIAIVAADADDLAQKINVLQALLPRTNAAALLQKQGIFLGCPDRPPRTAAVFPGQGAQYPNMLRAAAARFSVLRTTLAEADRAYEEICGRALTPSFFTEAAAPGGQQIEDIHCAVFAVSSALFRLFQSYGLRPDAVMGQSAGELAALVGSGALAFADGLRAMRERTIAVLALDLSDPGQMVALSCSAGRAERLMPGLPGYATVAADNSPIACIIAGTRAAMAMLAERCAQDGIECTALAVSHAYHSQIISGAEPRYRRALNGFAFRSPRCTVISTITGASMEALSPKAYPAHLARQYVLPVRLVDAVEALYRDGARLFIECGPKWPLTSFIGQILGERPHIAQASLHPKVGEVEQIHRSLACLFVHGLGSLRAENAPCAALDLDAPLQRATEEVDMTHPEPGQDEALALLRSIYDQVGALLQQREPVPAPQTASASPAHVSPTGATMLPDDFVANSPDRFGQVRIALLSRVMTRTGYPEEMLELDLDLEADLGIDTVKQIAIIAETRAALGLEADPDFKLRDHATLRKVVQYLVGRVAQGAASSPGALPAPLSEAAGVVPLTAPAPMQKQEDAPASPTGKVAAQVEHFESVRSALLDRVMTRTGYPEEMLELDLDLEADLGIDTVKQIAIIADVRASFGLQPDPEFKLRDYATLRKVAHYLAGRVAARDDAGAVVSPVLRGPRTLIMNALTAGEPGTYAPGADARPLVTEARCLQLLLIAARSEAPNDRCVCIEGLRVGAPAFLPESGPLQLSVLVDDVSAGLHCQVTSDVATHMEATVLLAPTESPPDLPPEVRVVLDCGGKPHNGLALLTSTRRGAVAQRDPAQQTVMWARGSRFDEVIGGLRLGEAAEAAPEAKMAELLTSAFCLADFGWYGLSGAIHWLASVRKTRFFALPRAGEDLLLYVRLLPPEDGTWGADVLVADGSLKVVAQILGLRGRPAGQLAGALGIPGPAKQTALDWQHFYRRMHSRLIDGEDRAW